MTTPASSPFSVAVTHNGIIYDVEFIFPMLNGKPVEWLKDRVDQWNTVEKSHKLFSRVIEQMLNDISIPSDKLVISGTKEGFQLENGSIVPLKDPKTWDLMESYLQDPAPAVAGKDPVVEDDTGVKVRFSPNAFKNLSEEEKKGVRSSLFRKGFRDHFAGKKEINIADYDQKETVCAKLLLESRSDKAKPINTLQELIMALWNSKTLAQDERRSLAKMFRATQAEAATASMPAVDSDSADISL